ncbi:unnamed protein product [Sphacelaria rigidula]
MQIRKQRPRSPPPPPRSCSSPVHGARQNPRHQHCGEDPSSLGLDKLSLIDRARALCAAADDVQKATIEASRRIAAIHGDSPNRQRRNERNKKAKKQTVQEPPDICARPPSDIPPPRGEGWRRIGEVAVVRGSNRLSAPSHARRALVRHVDVFVGGGQYSVVPADIEPGGGFCVTLNRDFEGETNMACMLYMRKRGGGGGEDGPTFHRTTNETYPPLLLYPSSVIFFLSTPQCTLQVVSPPISVSPSCKPAAPVPAPFGSVGETAIAATPNETLVTLTTGEPTAATTTTKSIPPSGYHSSSRSSPLKDSSAACKERDLDISTITRRQAKATGDGDSNPAAVVQKAQQRARRRSLSQRKRAMAEKEENRTKECEVMEIERLKASRRAALVRVSHRKQQQDAQNQEFKQALMEEGKRKEADVMAKVDAQRAAAVARAAKVAAQNMLREQELENEREAEARLKRERVAAVLARKDADVVERERQIRHETFKRIRLEERRRDRQRQREVDEREERIRLYEAGEGAAAATAAVGLGGGQHLGDLSGTPTTRSSILQPPVQSARSFFSVGTRPSSRHSVRSGSSTTDEGCDSGHYAGDVVSTGIQPLEAVDGGRSEGSHRKRGKRLHPSSELQAQKFTWCQTSRQWARSMTENTTSSEYDCADTHGLPTTTKDPTTTHGENGAGDHGFRKFEAGSLNCSAGGSAGPEIYFPTGTASSRVDSAVSGSGSGSGSGSAGSSVQGSRRRITATPVWKRPVVPLSKPYVPMPSKNSGRFSVVRS